MTSCHIPVIKLIYVESAQPKAEDHLLSADCRVHHVALAGGPHQLCRPLRHGHECSAAVLRGCGFRGSDERRGKPK